jgi:hypothetical protein
MELAPLPRLCTASPPLVATNNVSPDSRKAFAVTGELKLTMLSAENSAEAQTSTISRDRFAHFIVIFHNNFWS